MHGSMICRPKRHCEDKNIGVANRKAYLERNPRHLHRVWNPISFNLFIVCVYAQCEDLNLLIKTCKSHNLVSSSSSPGLPISPYIPFPPQSTTGPQGPSRPPSHPPSRNLYSKRPLCSHHIPTISPFCSLDYIHPNKPFSIQTKTQHTNPSFNFLPSPFPNPDPQNLKHRNASTVLLDDFSLIRRDQLDPTQSSPSPL